mgnify:CR=1 FL=1
MKEKLSLLYKIIIIIACGFGIYLNFKTFTIGGAIIYYTVQSNVMCFIFYLVTVILKLTGKLKKNSIYYILKGMVTMAITVTMIVFQFVITDSGMSAYAGNELASIMAHIVVPLLVMSDYVIFGEKGNLKRNYPFIWSATLVFYIIFDFIYVALGGRFGDGSIYPYLYMNIEVNGLLKVIISCITIFILFIGYGTIIQTIDQKLGKK